MNGKLMQQAGMMGGPLCDFTPLLGPKQHFWVELLKLADRPVRQSGHGN